MNNKIKNNIPIQCDQCKQCVGENAILEIFHHGPLGGHFLCIDCYNLKNLLNIKNKNRIKKKCKVCSYINNNENSYPNCKIHWYGKYNNIIMCEKCLFNKSRRRK
jgi:hypothetical protein